MKRVTYAETSLLLDDDAADWLLEYARALGTVDGTDTVSLRGLNRTGEHVEATFLLNASTQLVAESARGAETPPPNDEVVRYMQDRVAVIIAPPPALPDDWNRRFEAD